MSRSSPGHTVRVALDVLGGDGAPDTVVDGALIAVDADPAVQVLLVGPPEVAEPLLVARGAAGRLRTVAASQVVDMTEDPAKAVRAKPDATVRVAARLVRDGQADALVSIGSTGATLAAAVFTLHRLRGMARPALAVVVPARAGPLVLLDAGATVEADVSRLCQYALAGAAYARVRLGLADPRVGLLSVGEEEGKGDQLRKDAFAALRTLPLRFIGNVEGRDVPHGGPADVVVTDGFTGNVLLKGLEGAASMVNAVLRDALTEAVGPAAAAPGLAALAQAADLMSPETLGGGVLLGVDGVAVVGHGASSARAVAGCVAVAAQAVREQLVPRLAQALVELLDQQPAAVRS